jgi:hypothetical protein
MLLVLFLLGSAAPAVSRMDCLMSGRSEVSLGHAKECCPEDGGSQGAAVKAVCCEVFTAEPGKQPFAPQPPVLIPVQQVAVMAFQVQLPPMELHRPGVHVDHRPPPPSLSERLAEVSCFLI